MARRVSTEWGGSRLITIHYLFLICFVIVFGLGQVAFFVVEFPNTDTFALVVVALVIGYSVLAEDNVGAFFKTIVEVGFYLGVAVGEVEEYAAAAGSVGETFGATYGVVAIELYDVLMDA